MRARTSTILFSLFVTTGFSQPVPGETENIDYVMTYCQDARAFAGDDDFLQAFYISIPKDTRSPLYIRIFDPNVGGMHDAHSSGVAPRTMFHVFSGTGERQSTGDFYRDPEKYALKGNLIDRRAFDADGEYDNKWFSFGPINPLEGELHADGKYYFRIVSEGLEGNAGNAFKYFLSTSPDENVKVKGASWYTYEYTFRISKKNDQSCHLYPFLSKDVIALKQENFDLDGNASIRLFSVAKFGEPCKVSENGTWRHSIHRIDKSEVNRCIEISISNGSRTNNDAVFSVRNQRGELLPFVLSPTNLNFNPQPRITVYPRRN